MKEIEKKTNKKTTEDKRNKWKKWKKENKKKRKKEKKNNTIHKYFSLTIFIQCFDLFYAYNPHHFTLYVSCFHKPLSTDKSFFISIKKDFLFFILLACIFQYFFFSSMLHVSLSILQLNQFCLWFMLFFFSSLSLLSDIHFHSIIYNWRKSDCFSVPVVFE